MLLLRYYHQQVHHQGQQITHGALRNAGYWLVGGHRVMRYMQEATRFYAGTEDGRPTPLTNVGFDMFGPWTVKTRRTRGGVAESKRWGLVFTCLVSRAIHIELLETLDASSFICVVRRFLSIRGPALLTAWLQTYKSAFSQAPSTTFQKIGISEYFRTS